MCAIGRGCRPLTGARIETSTLASDAAAGACRPLTGARIETWRIAFKGLISWSPPHRGADRNTAEQVAGDQPRCRPLTGARIETAAHAHSSSAARRSPPHRGADRNSADLTIEVVAECRPLTGARIETGGCDGCLVRACVAPSQGRGSKHGTQRDDAHRRSASPPHRGADRNLSSPDQRLHTLRRPLTGARIETTCSASSSPRRTVAPSQGRGSKPRPDRTSSRAAGRPLTGARIETASISSPGRGSMVAPSQGRGSKLLEGLLALPLQGRPLTGARIETGLARRVHDAQRVAPSQGRGSKLPEP